MAATRLHKIGTIFSRASGLLKSGAIKPQDKPVWYDVYEHFPPKFEPRYDRPPIMKDIKPIFYPEDVIRAKFYNKYGTPGIINMSDTNTRPSLCQHFVTEYQRLQQQQQQQQQQDPNEDQLMEEAALALEEKGLYLNPSRAPQKADGDAALESDESASVRSKISKVSFTEVFKSGQQQQQQKQQEE